MGKLRPISFLYELADRTICVGGPDAARGPPVGQPCIIWYDQKASSSLSFKFIPVQT